MKAAVIAAFLVAGIVTALTPTQPAYTRCVEPIPAEAEEPEPAKGPQSIQEEIYEGELEMLAALVFAEAGNQDMIGKRLVVDVVLNRVDSPFWPNSITAVVFQKHQFSPAENGALSAAYKGVTPECYEAVRLELEERLDSEVVYFNGGSWPGYGTPAYQHGDHFFSKR